jgi:glycosyltransferase involved in cell wall biosynthesis
MKIIHIIPNLKKGGAERLVLDICNELQKREGVVVKLITFSQDNEYEFLSKNINWEVIPATVQLSIVRKNNIQVDQLQKVIENFHPDIIHTHLYEADLTARACYYPSAKWFFHCHSPLKIFKKNHQDLKKNIIYKFERNYLFNRIKENGGSNFITISKNTQNYFKDKVKNYDLFLLPNAINCDSFNSLEDKKLNKKLHLVNIGSLTKVKNHVFLIKVANNLKTIGVDFKFYFLGDGILRENLENEILKYGLEKYIILKGKIDDISHYLKKSDIYIHGSLYESFGLTILEAMAAGLPVVTIDGEGNRDLIVEGENGYILKNDDIENFTKKILSIYSNPNKYYKMSSYAKKFAKQYDIKYYTDKLLNIYNSRL